MTMRRTDRKRDEEKSSKNNVIHVYDGKTEKRREKWWNGKSKNCPKKR
jgi:hypothetical protein